MCRTKRCVSQSTLDRRRLLQLTGGVGGLLAVGPARPGLSALAAQDKTTITFWTPGGSPVFCDVHTKIAAEYGTVNPAVEVDFQCGTDSDTFMERLLGSIAAGNPPDATIFWDTPVSLGVRGALLALDDLMAASQYSKVENWPAGVLASCQFGGKTWGLPVTAGSYGIWYNEELFEAKGIPSDPASFPKTWDDLRALSKEFTRWEGDRLVSAGFLPFEPQDLPYTLPIWSALNGSQLYDAANQQYTIDSEQNVAMMEYFVAWLDEEYQGSLRQVLSSGSWRGYPSDEGQPPEFQAGNLAGTEWGSWGMGDFYAFGEPTFERWNVAPYPVGPGGSKVVAGYWPNWLIIPDNAANAEAAFGYLDYLSGVGVAEWYAVVPDTPTNTAVPPTVPQVAVEKRGEEFAKVAADFFKTQLDSATPMWDSPVQSFAVDQIRPALERIMNKEAAAKDALAEAQQACQAELEKVLSGGA